VENGFKKKNVCTYAGKINKNKTSVRKKIEG
jgi:hypothetical protein